MQSIALDDEGGLLSAREGDIIIKAVEQAFSYHAMNASVCVMAVDSTQMREYNLLHRGIDNTTDCLSFPCVGFGEFAQDGYYGDIIICPSIAKSQADTYGHSYERELAFLSIHGALHLIGYDHEKTEDEMHMRKTQSTILERMGL